MAKRACAGQIEIGPTPTALGELRAWRQNDESQAIDTSIMGNCVGRETAGFVTQRIEVDCFYEAADAGQILVVVGQEGVQIILYPQGNASGNPRATGNFNITGKEITAAVDGAIEMSFTATADENGITWDTVTP